MSIFATLVLLSQALGQQAQKPSEILDMLVKSRESSPSEHRALIPLLPEDTRLNKMYNGKAMEINRIMTSFVVDSSGETAALKALRDTVPASEETNYLVEQCHGALASEPPNWDILQKCFFVGENGHKDDHLISIATSLVSFKDVDTVDVSTDQIAATLAAMTMLARLDWPERFEFMKQCTKGILWRHLDIRSSVRPDLARLLQNHAILNLAALPVVQAGGIVEELERQYPPSLVEEKACDGPLAMAVAMVKLDLERQTQGLSAIVDGIR